MDTLSIPSILGKQTDIDKVLTIIFNDDKYNKDQQIKAEQDLSDLYDSFIYTFINQLCPNKICKYMQ